MVLLDGYLIVGATEALKEVLKVKARDGAGSLNQDSENSLKKAYDDARAGWYVLVSEKCDEFSSSLRSCEAYSISGGQGKEDFLVDLTYRFQFRSEQRAESQALDIEDWLDDRGWNIDLEEVKADGASVEAKASGDEEDFRMDWLVSYSGVRTPPPHPTAVLEPESPTAVPEFESRRTTGTTTATAVGQPTAAPTLASVSAGIRHTCGVKTGGSVVCCGQNDEGQATPPAGPFSSASAGLGHTCGLKTDRSVACWGQNDEGQATPPAGSFFSVSAGLRHTCGVKTGGSVVCWGWNNVGQATPPAVSPLVGSFAWVSAGYVHTCGQMTDRSVVCWGLNSDGQAKSPAGSFASVRAGVRHTCGVRTGGSVVCWGLNDEGQATPPAGPFSSVSGGGGHTCGVEADGSVACWGNEQDGRGHAAGRFLRLGQRRRGAHLRRKDRRLRRLLGSG